MNDQIHTSGNQEAGIDEPPQQMIASTGQRFGNMVLDLVFYFVFAFVFGVVIALIGLGDIIEEINGTLLGLLLCIHSVNYTLYS